MGKRILVVEDDADNRRIVETVLRLEGHQVTTAEDGFQAIEMLGRSRPDLVLLDLDLPRLDGWQTLERIRQSEANPRLPVIALTGLALPGDEERARRAGCDDYLSKPCRPAHLREKVRHWLARPAAEHL